MHKILHLSHTYIRCDPRILKEMSVMANLGHNVSGFGVHHEEHSKASSFFKNLDIHAISLRSKKYTFLPTPIRHTLSIFELTGKMLYKAIKLKPKVIHCNGTVVLPLGVIVKIITGSRLIYDAHELESARNGLTRILGKTTLFVERLLWGFVDALIVVSPSIDAWYKKNIGAKYSQIILNSPVLETDDTTYNKSYLRDCFSIPENSKIFLYIGALCQGRGIDLIVDAFKDSELKSSVVFLGYGELSDDLKELAEKNKNIYVHDAVPHEKVVSIAKSADVGLCLIQNVSLSYYYCLPNKLFEYCFAGIPVLASNFPDLSDMVNAYKLGICCDLNLTSITQAIKKFEEGGVDVNFNVSDLGELSWQAQEKKLIALYDNVLSGKINKT